MSDIHTHQGRELFAALETAAGIRRAPLALTAPIPSLDVAGALAILSREIPAYRLAFGDELRLHTQLAEIIGQALPGERVIREHVLDQASRIDFYLPRLRLGLEVKVKGGPSAVLRQLQRYLASPDIAHLVLITSRPYLLHLARPLADRPFTVVRLLEGHL